jgi:hypothetical protein
MTASIGKARNIYVNRIQPSYCRNAHLFDQIIVRSTIHARFFGGSKLLLRHYQQQPLLSPVTALLYHESGGRSVVARDC